MIDIMPTIMGLDPENTIRIHPIGGGIVGVSNLYEIIATLSFNPVKACYFTSELTIINSRHYCFENDKYIKKYSSVFTQQGQQIHLPFRIKNKIRNPVPLEMTLCIYENISGPNSKLCRNGLFPVVIEHNNATIINFT